VAAVGNYFAASPPASDGKTPIFIPSPAWSERTRPMLRQRVRELVQRYAKGLDLPKGIARPHALHWQTGPIAHQRQHGADAGVVSTDNLGMSSMNRLIAVPPFMAKCGVSKMAGALSSKSRTISM